MSRTKQIVYVACKINGDANFVAKFQQACDTLSTAGYIPLNPAILPAGMNYEEYMTICYAMIEIADKVYMLDDYLDSPGALREELFAKAHLKQLYYQGKGELL